MFSIGANADSNYHIDVVTKDMTTGEIYTERVYPTNRPDLPSTRSSNSIIGDMDREPLDDPKDSICYIESTFSDGSGITGTGFVVGNNIVVTAGHVIYDKSGETGYAVKVDVYPGHSAGKGSPFGKFNSTSLHVTNNYAYESTGSDITRAYYDIGIIELGTNIEAKTGSWALEYTGYNFNDVFLNQNFSIIGYDDHGINSSQYYSAGKVTGVHVMGTIDTPVIPGETRTENSALVINKLYYDWIYDYVDGIL